MTANKQRALTALLSSRTQAEAAQAAGLDPRTIRRYMEDEEFLSEYKRQLAGMIDAAADQAKRALCPTLGTLQDITEDTGQPGNIRVSAGRAVLEFGLKLIEQADVLDRLSKLEEQMEGENYYGKY